MKRLLAFLMIALLLLPALASGAESGYELNTLADGAASLTVGTGEEIKISLIIKSPDGNSFPFGAFQCYTDFDPEYLSFVPGSIVATPIAEADPISYGAGYESVYVSRISKDEPSQTYTSGETIVTFLLKAGEKTGSTAVKLRGIKLRYDGAALPITGSSADITIVPPEERPFPLAAEADGSSFTVTNRSGSSIDNVTVYAASYAENGRMNSAEVLLSGEEFTEFESVKSALPKSLQDSDRLVFFFTDGEHIPLDGPQTVR